MSEPTCGVKPLGSKMALRVEQRNGSATHWASQGIFPKQLG